MKSMVLIGNPGCGKSTTVNCMLKKHLFKSGISTDGVGVTRTLDMKEHMGTRYMDTPGLSDMKLRKEAAQAIEGALAMGGDFQIIFVMTQKSGRLEPDDILTMKLVLEAANQIPQNGYSIMINKVSKKLLQQLNRPAFISNINDDLASRGSPTTDHIHFAPNIEDLEDACDEVVDLPPDTHNFIQNAPRLIIDGGKVQAVNAASFEDIKNAIEEEQAQKKKAVEARREAELREKEAREQQSKEKALRISAEKDRQEACRQAAHQAELREKQKKVADDAVQSAQLAKEEAEAKEKQIEALQRARDQDAEREKAAQESLEKQKQATAQREAELEAESKRLEALARENQNKHNEAEKRLREKHDKLQRELEDRKKAEEKAAEERAREAAKFIREGALVYIRSSQGHYITDKVLGNGYAGITKSGSMNKAKFLVSYNDVSCSSSHANSGIRLEHRGANFATQYAEGYRYLYASTSGYRYCAYDQKLSNTKQLWQPESVANRMVLGNGTLKYDTAIILRDCFVFSVLCACKCECDANCEYLCAQYENASEYLDTAKSGHCKTWYLERAV